MDSLYAFVKLFLRDPSHFLDPTNAHYIPLFPDIYNPHRSLRILRDPSHFLDSGNPVQTKKGANCPFSQKDRFVILEFLVPLIRRYLILIQITHCPDHHR